MQTTCLAVLFCCWGILVAPAAAQMHYLVGVGKGDVTGPLEVNMMGYAMVNQTATGIHTRQFARAYVFADPEAPQKRFVFVTVDAAMVSQLITQTVIRQLQVNYGDLYSSDNVAISATHTHAASGAYMDHFLYHITSLGFVKQSFDALVDGILEACVAAHDDLRPATVDWAEGELLGANINRSPTAYQANPVTERAQYKHDVDKDMTVLMIKSGPSAAAADGTAVGPPRGRGLISFFPVHPTSMSNTNRLLSGDNKGAAEQFVEKFWAADQKQDMEPGFAAAFVQSNGADASPNILGSFCSDTGLPCDQVTSTCNGNNHLCIGRGPAYPDEFKSTQIIGQRQADKAQELWQQGSGRSVTGPVDYRHKFVRISDMWVPASNFTRSGHTCAGALGYSFAAGTTDGPGARGFFQSDRRASAASPLVNLVNGLLINSPSIQQSVCQAPKPILLNVGETSRPYPWVPRVSEVSLLRLGSFVIVGLPGEFTTMAGRRLRNAVFETVKGAWGRNTKVVLATMTNTYSSYVSTYEEYVQQRYEGASTLYGPYTLDAYIHTAVQMAQAMVDGKPVSSNDVEPEDFASRLTSLVPPVVTDTVPLGSDFGEVVRQPRAAYMPGETVEAVFQSAHPRNNLRHNATYLEVERLDPVFETWSVIHTDDDFCTKFIWDRPAGRASQSLATVLWEIPADAAPGLHRIKHYGDAKALGGRVRSFTGMTHEFAVGSSQVVPHRRHNRL